MATARATLAEPPAPEASILPPVYPHPVAPVSTAPPPVSPAIANGAPERTAQRAGDDETRRPGCYMRCFGGHTIVEAGLSFWAHPYLLATTRFLSMLFLVSIALVIFFASWSYLTFDLSFPEGRFLSSSFYLTTIYFASVTALEATSFLLLGICSACASIGKRANFLASIAVPLHETAVACALFEIPLVVLVFWESWAPALLAFFFPQIALFLLDSTVLGAMVRFRFAYIWLAVVVLAVHIVVVAASAGFGFSGGFVILTFTILLIWSFVSGILVTAITMLTACIGARIKTQGAIEEVDAPVMNIV